MTGESLVERRRHPRTDVSTRVFFHHEPSRRDFPGRCLNLSAGGLLMSVPIAAPLREGHAVRVILSGPPSGPLAALAGRPIEGEVVRVNRNELPEAGRVSAGVRFIDPPDLP